jgi:magnesium transporter
MIVDYALYQGGRRNHRDASITELIDFARREGGFIWVGVSEPSTTEFAELAEKFEFHPLAVEDAVMAKQRAKLEMYEGMTFVGASYYILRREYKPGNNW